MLSRGADINARRLSRAANASLENLVSYNLISPTSANLVKMNVDLGATPLHFAVANDKFDVADYLVNSGGGARVLLMDEFNCTPLDLAIAKQVRKRGRQERRE